MEKNDAESENNSSEAQSQSSSQEAKKSTSVNVKSSTGETKPIAASASVSTTTTPRKPAPKKSPNTSLTSRDAPRKVKVHFVAVGSAPLMKKNKFQIGHDQRFSAVTGFLRKMLKLTGTGTSLFLYLKSAFVPSPDELVGDLNDCFSVRGELVIHYSLQEAWG